MNYVSNYFSPRMIVDGVFSKKELDEDTFTILLKEINPQSYMRDKKIASIYNLDTSDKNFMMGAGDNLLVAQMNKGELEHYMIKMLEKIQ